MGVVHRMFSGGGRGGVWVRRNKTNIMKKTKKQKMTEWQKKRKHRITRERGTRNNTKTQ